MTHSTPSPPTPSLLPYTTLFRSRVAGCRSGTVRHELVVPVISGEPRDVHTGTLYDDGVFNTICGPQGIIGADLQRSEEHTSELQSRVHLVCRHLLDIKKQHLLDE